MTNRQKYCLIGDDDGHWHLCPWERRDEANKILDSIDEYWQEEDYEKDCPEMPDWLQQIDGPHRLSFENPVEE